MEDQVAGLSKDSQTAHDISLMSRLEGQADSIIASLPGCTDDELDAMMVAAVSLERQAFRVRGAVASEMRKRVAIRLVGGRGHVDTEGVGIRATMARMAESTGLSARTLEEDAEIYETFFEGQPERSDSAAILPREMYRIAKIAPDPHAAIRVAEKNAPDPAYTTDRFRMYVNEIREREDRSKDEELADLYWLRAGLTQDGRKALVALVKRWKVRPGEAISRALIVVEDMKI
jgi:hypothetical protein